MFQGPFLTFFCAPEKKRISFFFMWGDPIQNRARNPASGGCLFSTRKSRSEVPERQNLGEENCLGKGGVLRRPDSRCTVRTFHVDLPSRVTILLKHALPKQLLGCHTWACTIAAKMTMRVGINTFRIPSNFLTYVYSY